MKYFAKIKYLGTGFCGFQVQPCKRTVQAELAKAVSLATASQCKITGCSRTDAGVHANEFCVTLECDSATVPPEKLPVAVARFLPNDLSLYYAAACEDGFHPRYDVKSKEYLYRIRNERIYDPFDFGRAWFFPRLLDERAIEEMRRAASALVGTHDFSAFMSAGSDTTDTVRTVFYVDVSKQGSEIDIKICANGFLYNMVRIIVGTLVEVGTGNKKASDVTEILLSKDRKRAGATAPPEGLYLNRVNY